MSYVDKVMKEEKKAKPKEAVNVLAMDRKFSSNTAALKVPGLHQESDEEEKKEGDDILDESSGEEFNDTEDEADQDEQLHSEASIKRQERDQRRGERALKDDILTYDPTKFAEVMKKQFGDTEFLEGYKIIGANSTLLFESGGEETIQKMIEDKVPKFKADSEQL